MHPYLTEEDQDLIVNTLLKKLQLDQQNAGKESLCNEI